MLLPKISEAELVASICREDFYSFVREFWSTVVMEPPVWNWHIPLICNELQVVAERVFEGKPKKYDLIINISPGTTKSTVCSVLFPAWVWTRMPVARVISASHTYTLALDLARRCRDCIRSDKYREVFGITLRDDQDTKGYYINKQGGDRFSAGVGGSVTGMHGHFIIIDDPIDPTGAKSDEEIKTANHWTSETIPSRKVNKMIVPMITIMQRLHQNDPTGYLLAKEKDNIRHICLPAEDSENVKPASLRRYYTHDPKYPDRTPLMDIRRLGWDVLDEARTDLGEYGYSGQYRQHPVPLGGGMFKVARLIVEDTGPPKHMIKARARYWDKAGTPGGGAYTVGGLLTLTKDGHFWIEDIVRGQWGTDERERRIQQTAQLDGRDTQVGLEQEPGSGGKESVEATTKRLAGYRVRVNKPTGDKALRADPFSVQVNNGTVHVLNRPWTPALLQEMEFFPFSTFKDQVDALAGSFNILTQGKKRAGVIVERRTPAKNT